MRPHPNIRAAPKQIRGQLHLREHGAVNAGAMSAIDRLLPGDKLAVPAASVLGERFALAPLRHVVDSAGYAAPGLIARRLTRRDRRVSEPA